MTVMDEVEQPTRLPVSPPLIVCMRCSCVRRHVCRHHLRCFVNMRLISVSVFARVNQWLKVPQMVSGLRKSGLEDETLAREREARIE